MNIIEQYKTATGNELTDAEAAQLKAVHDRFVGKKVLIVAKDHPYANTTGTVDRMEFAAVPQKFGFVVEYDNGGSGFVFNQKDWRVLS